MIDLSRILDDVFADLRGRDALPLPTVPTPLPTERKQQGIDTTETSHTSRTSHIENEASRKTHDEKPSNIVVSANRARVTSSHDEGVGNAGSVGSGAKTLAESALLPFPQDLEVVGSVGSEGATCGRPFLNLNHAAPQRSDWWIGPAIAEAEGPVPPPGAPLPIAPADVRAGVARELRALAEDGREGPASLRDAVEITRAKIRNSEALAERQVLGGRCHVCDGSLDDSAPVVAVLSWSRGEALHLHAGCHDAYSARRIAIVDRIMASAGYGAEQPTGAAA